MNSRNLSILIGTFCVGAAIGIAFFSQGAQAVALPPGGDDYATTTEIDQAVAKGEHILPTPAEGTYHQSNHGPISVATSDRKLESTEGWTSGVIRGDVQLAVSILDKLGSITVIVEEMRNPFAKKPKRTRDPEAKEGEPQKAASTAPHRLYATVNRGEGTPTFEVRDVPFSDYPYRVTLHAAGLNGSQRVLAVNEDQPLHDIRLRITPGVPFSVLLRDQDSGSYPDIDVLLRPTGLPHGRARLAGKTDNFGSVVFADVLAGQYELVTTLNGQPFGDPEIVTVLPGTRNFGRKIQGQGHVVTIERGVQVDVRISDRMGYAIKDCTVTATATDRRKLLELEGKTDGQGVLRFSRLLPGTWHLVVQKPGWQRIDQQLTIRQDQQPILRDIKLVRPLRRGR